MAFEPMQHHTKSLVKALHQTVQQKAYVLDARNALVDAKMRALMDEARNQAAHLDSQLERELSDQGIDLDDLNVNGVIYLLLTHY